MLYNIVMCHVTSLVYYNLYIMLYNMVYNRLTHLHLSFSLSSPQQPIASALLNRNMKRNMLYRNEI